MRENLDLPSGDTIGGGSQGIDLLRLYSAEKLDPSVESVSWEESPGHPRSRRSQPAAVGVRPDTGEKSSEDLAGLVT